MFTEFERNQGEIFFVKLDYGFFFFKIGSVGRKKERKKNL